MPVYQLIFACLLSLLVQPVAALTDADILPPDQVFRLTVVGQSRDKVVLEWQIEPGYHLYRDKTKVESQTQGIKIVGFEMPAGVVEHDAAFGDTSVYRNQLRVDVPLLNPEGQGLVQLLVKYQGCADRGICYPPQKKIIDVSLPAAQATKQNDGVNAFFGGLKKLTPSLFEAELLPPDQAFQFFATVKDAHTLHLTWLIADGYYLYKHKLAASLSDGSRTRLAALPLPAGEAHLDEEFGQVEVYRNELSLDVPVLRQSTEAETLELSAKFQGCADRGVCYPPMNKTEILELPQAQALLTPVDYEANAPASEQDQIVNALKNDSLLLTLLSFFGFGLLLAFTPCVFPMVPILSGIIVGHGHQVSTRKAFLLSASFVFASALMYTVFGVLAALFGSNLQAAFQAPWVIGSFSGLFVLLSLSMFGFYNLQLPAALQSRLHQSSDQHRDGSYWGAGIMGALSSLIVGPCVAAPLAAALIYIGQTGDVVLGGSALFMMGLGMGLPLLLVGASAGKFLPKAGEWMNATKAVFGVIMLAVAVWMLSRILPPTVTMFLSAMLLIIPAIYLNAIEPLQQATGWKRLWKGVGLIMLVFGVMQLIGLGAGNTNPLQPLAGMAVVGQGQAKTGLEFQRVRSSAELQQVLEQAQANQQWVMLDFYADWCVSCKEMEAYTFTDAQVKQHLQNFMLIQADVTENNEDDKALLQRFNLVGPPGIIFFDTAGQERSHNRIIGFQDAATFVNSLKQL